MADVTQTRPVEPVSTSLDSVLSWLQARPDAPLRQVRGDARGVVVTGISLSSQRIVRGDLYVALPGSRAHGAAYAADAVAAGAVAVLTDADGAARCAAHCAEPWADPAVPVLVVDRPRRLLGDLAAYLHEEPARALTLMAVTGTQGKTTTTRLLEEGLEKAGVRAAVVGTVGTRLAGTELHTALTTPEAPDLHALFALMREQHVAACAMEVSSHALVMGRVDGVVFDAAAFLNLGRDHLDFHKDVEHYFAAKASLFTPQRTRCGLTNIDDEHGRRLLEVAKVPMRTFSAAGDDADWRAVDVALRPDGSTFTVLGPDGLRLQAGVPLTGTYNVTNALCAIALAAEARLDPEVVAAGIARSSGVPGRLERVDAGQEFLTVVDYAHKPDAVAAAVEALRPLTTGRLILVLGAGGDRDTGKRTEMGAIGARLADVLVVTDDNPRSEDPAAIRAAILAGARAAGDAPADVLEVGERRTAIRQAIALARAGDTVLVAGKGHETGQEVAGVVHPFDDRDEVRAALEAR